jgi:hypothetical protein
MSRGFFASMGKLPPTIPEINRDAWSTLARSAANFQNRMAVHETGKRLSMIFAAN